LEELQWDLSPHVFGMVLGATVMADVVIRGATGQLPSFHVSRYPVPSLAALPLFVFSGILVGLAGIAFNRCLLGALRAFESLCRLPSWAWSAFAQRLSTPLLRSPREHSSSEPVRF
jgi:H+/Cl- antiporter ClcA